jgi:hypothetical protein
MVNGPWSNELNCLLDASAGLCVDASMRGAADSKESQGIIAGRGDPEGF